MKILFGPCNDVTIFHRKGCHSTTDFSTNSQPPTNLVITIVVFAQGLYRYKANIAIAKVITMRITEELHRPCIVITKVVSILASKNIIRFT